MNTKGSHHIKHFLQNTKFAETVLAELPGSGSNLASVDTEQGQPNSRRHGAQVHGVPRTGWAEKAKKIVGAV
jgi:hypothetical protein